MFDFYSGKSVEKQLILTYNSVTQWIDKGNTVDLVLYDFDTANHQILFIKFYSISINGAVLSWIKVFLFNRTLEVVERKKTSSTFPEVSGVPQGFVLGPVPFSIYRNYIASTLS